MKRSISTLPIFLIVFFAIVISGLLAMAGRDVTYPRGFIFSAVELNRY